ncbi:MAG: hypothetical protein WCG12_10385 [Alcaligenaceae bacterium]
MRLFQMITLLVAAAGIMSVNVGCVQSSEPPGSPAAAVKSVEPTPNPAAAVQSVEPTPNPPAAVQSAEPPPNPAAAVQSAEPPRNPVAAVQSTEQSASLATAVQSTELPRNPAAGTPVAAIKDTAASLRTAAILLAGQQPVTGLPPSIAQSPRWATFAKEVTENWTRYSQKIADPMSQWALAELSVASDTVFYPFSGPDFVTVHQLFPEAKRYVMMAMQNAERPLDLANLAPELIDPSLGVLTSAWKHFGENGFYVTEYLEKYLYSTRANIGASTFIVSFLTLQGFEIERVVPIQVTADGSLQELAPDTPRWRSVRIQASKQGRPVVIDYLKIDLSNPGLQAAPENLTLISTLTKNPVLFKAASHLPQNVGFSVIANQVLENSSLIVQDETGLSYSTLIRAHQVALFGKFVVAHHSFQSYHVDLAKAFAQRDDTKPLPFRFGYFKDGNYALMIASRK